MCKWWITRHAFAWWYKIRTRNSDSIVWKSILSPRRVIFPSYCLTSPQLFFNTETDEVSCQISVPANEAIGLLIIYFMFIVIVGKNRHLDLVTLTIKVVRLVIMFTHVFTAINWAIICNTIHNVSWLKGFYHHYFQRFMKRSCCTLTVA